MKFSRILWLLPNSSLYLFTSLIKGLELLGVTVLSIDYREEVLCLGISKARNKIINEIDNFNPDVVLAAFFRDTYELSPEFLREISLKTPLVLFASDDSIYGTWQSIYFAQSGDAVIVSQNYERTKYERLSIPTVVYYYFGLDFVYPFPVDKKEIDVSFVGDCAKADRNEYIEFLRKNGINVVAYGRGSENGFISRMELLKIISKSKINLNFTKCDVSPEVLKNSPWRAYLRLVKGRPFEVSQMRSFCLSEFAEDIGFAYVVGDEIDAFNDKEELLEKVKYYLENDAKREKMATKAFEKTISEYAGLEYLCRSFNLLHEKLQSNRLQIRSRPIFRSFEFNVSEVKWNFIIFVKLLWCRKFVLGLGVVPYFIRFKLSCLVGLWHGVIELISRKFSYRK